MRSRTILCGLGLTFVSACHYRPAPVPLAGDPRIVRELAGTWTGTYVGTDTRRFGNISFIVRVAGDSAFGDVLMEMPPGLPVIRPADDATVRRAPARDARLLAVRFVSIAGGEISGALEPYVAPDCDCTVTTIFTGRVRGDTIRGTFETRGRMIATQTGAWVVGRER